MEIFDIAIVATLRPELLKRTIDSFIKNLWKGWAGFANIYLNIDKAGEEDEKLVQLKVGQIVEMVSKTFDRRKVKINIKDPHFPTAWLWCIQNTTSDYVFHLEEDWVVNYPHDFEVMYGLMIKYPNLAHLRLNQFKSDDKTTKLWSKHFANYNGDFFEIKDIIKVGYCGHPSLNDGNWLRAAAKNINPQRNPEKQFHFYPEVVNKFVVGKQFGIFQPPNSSPGISDIGRQWRIEKGYAKTGGTNDEWFTSWKKI